MASRKDQKEAARQRRMAEEQAAASKAQRTRRLQMLGGVLAVVIVVVVVLVVVSSSGSGGGGKAVAAGSSGATKTTKTVDTLLKGIPQSGTTLGSPKARVTVTEFGDLVCPICQSFALGAENQLISNDVRSGKVKLVYRGLETASQTANNSMYVATQTAMRAAGEQDKAWNYIETFYHEQQSEDTSYVTNPFLQNLAKQVTGLDFAKWDSGRSSSSLANLVNQDENAAASQNFDSTPTLVIQGPVSQAKPIVGAPTYAGLESEIKSVA
jgi:protein-disulfide isomerase